MILLTFCKYTTANKQIRNIKRTDQKNLYKFTFIQSWSKVWFHGVYIAFALKIDRFRRGTPKS